MIHYMQLSKLSFFCLCETKEARKRREVCTRLYFKKNLNCGERKRNIKSHGKENKKKLDCRTN